MGEKLSKHSLSGIDPERKPLRQNVRGISTPRIRLEAISCSDPPGCRGARPVSKQRPTLDQDSTQNGRTRHQSRDALEGASDVRA